eukprot:13135887-Alexandrium_andersonii.AAC.1
MDNFQERVRSQATMPRLAESLASPLVTLNCAPCRVRFPSQPVSADLCLCGGWPIETALCMLMVRTCEPA